jgi:PHP family Zn ribbon phosphoesterase
VAAERQNRAVRQVLLDLVGEGPIELPQYDPDIRVEIPRKESDVQIEMIVGRKREDRDRVTHLGAV